MTSRQVDALLDERARLVAQRAATQGHLWFAECLLHRVEKLLPHLIADSPHNAVARDTIADEIREFLSEPRDHGAPDLSLPAGAAGRTGPNEGTGGQGGTTLADDVAAGLHEEPHP
jgi:hypothetical protein